MSLLSALLILHILGATAWVGGMFFSVVVMRPSLAVLEPAQRLAVLGVMFKRFFLVVWHAMPIMLLTGFGMVHFYGGFAALPWNVNAMLLLGLIMAAVFLATFFGPWRQMRAALARQDRGAATACVGRIRTMVTSNLALGIVTIVLAAWG